MTNTTTKSLLRPLTSRLVSIVPLVDQSKVFGSIVYDKAICVMAKAEFNRIHGAQKKVKIFEGVVVNVYQQITDQRWK